VNLVLGGKVGREISPVYPEEPTYYNYNERIKDGGWVKLAVRLWTPLFFFSGYEIQGIEYVSSIGTRREWMQMATAGLIWRW
jgi:hypothetical protein